MVTETVPTVGVTLASRHGKLRAWAWRLAPVWTGIAALALDLLLLGRRSVRFEEAQAAAAVSGDWDDLWRAIRGVEAPHALADVLLAGWVEVAGDSAVALRIPAAVAGAVAVGLTCIVGTRLLGRVGGLLAAGVLATNAAVLAWSQTARGATLLLAAVSLATVVLLAALTRPTTWRWAGWAIAACAAMLASVLAVPVILAHALTAIVATPAGQRRPPTIAATAAAAAATVSVSFVATSGAAELTTGIPEGLDVARGVWQLLGWNAVAVVIAALGAIALARSWVPATPPWTTLLIGSWLASVAGGAVLLALARSSFDPRYAAAATPALAVLTAAGVVSQQGRVRLALMIAVAIGGCVAVAVWFAGPSEEDWRGAVRAIRAERQPGEAVLVLPVRQRVALEYYAGPGLATPRVSGPRVWVMLAELSSGRRLDLARSVVRPPRYALLEERRYGDGLWLQLWVRP